MAKQRRLDLIDEQYNIPEVDMGMEEVLNIIQKADVLCIGLAEIIENNIAPMYCELLEERFKESRTVEKQYNGKILKAIVYSEFECSLQPGSAYELISSVNLLEAVKNKKLSKYIVNVCNVQMWASVDVFVNGKEVWHSALLDSVSVYNLVGIDLILNAMSNVALSGLRDKFKYCIDSEEVIDISFPDEICGNFNELINQEAFYETTMEWEYRSIK